MDKGYGDYKRLLPEDVSKKSSHRESEVGPSFLPRERFINEFENRLLSLTKVLQEVAHDLSE